MIGNFGSKLINFVMVPLYTNVLITSEFGIVDIINTTIMLLVPFLSLELGQASLRFAIDIKEKDKQRSIFSNIFIHFLIVAILILIFNKIINPNVFFGGYGKFFIALLVLDLFNTMFSHYMRGLGLVREYAVNGILMTTVTVLLNIALLVYYKMGIEGYLYSLIISMLISNIYVLSTIIYEIGMSKPKMNKGLILEMIKFSLPMIPNTAMWWIINSSTRYFIYFYLGASANGLYAVANKIPNVIVTLSSIFTSAWQISSFEEYRNEGKDKFYSNVFNYLSMVLFLLVSVFLIAVKQIMHIYVDKEYFISWKIVPILLIAVTFQNFSGFLGTNYAASKQTKGAFFTSIYGGITSLAISLIFIPTLGLKGAATASVFSFVVMFTARYFDTKKFVIVNINFKKFVSSIIILILQIVFTYIDLKLGFIIQIALFVMHVILYRSDIINFIKLLLAIIRKRKAKKIL